MAWALLQAEVGMPPKVAVEEAASRAPTPNREITLQDITLGHPQTSHATRRT